LVALIRRQSVAPEDNGLLDTLENAPEHIADGQAPEPQESYVSYLRRAVPWGMLAPYLSCPPYLRDAAAAVWSRPAAQSGAFSALLQRISVPDTLYRYIRFRADWARELLSEGKLFMPCPAMFNDPFDCSLDESVRLTFIESAIGCFSTIPDDVLMFSHYADNHRGLCVGFDARRLLSSLTGRNKPLWSDLRPVWYFPVMPPLSRSSQPALCATCKHDIWAYEREFRVFIVRGSSLVPSGAFAFDREAISEVILGCKATDDTVAACKSLTDDLPSCKRLRAVQRPNQFGVQLHGIPRT
jgi:hypothetical protein